MDKTQIISEVKSLLLKGDTSNALSNLYNFLESDDKYDSLANTILQLKSQLAKIKKDESLGIISFDNAQLSYNRIGNALTRVLDQLEKGQLQPDVIKSKKNSKRTIIIGSLIGVLLAASFFIFKDKILPGSTSENTEITGCPSFESTSEFNILLLPFLNLSSEIPFFEESYRQRFNNYKNKLSFTTDIQIYQKKANEKINPANSKEAEVYANQCTDVVRLLLWGNYEKQSADKIITTTYYKFLNMDDEFSFTQLSVGENLETVTVNSVSSIATEGSATGDIEQLLLGIAANQMGHKETAIALLEELAPADSSTLLLWGMTLADSYLDKGEKAKAIQSYDQVLNADPDNRFALLNRAMLNYDSGNKEAAVADLNHHLEKNPNDNTVLYTRATIYVKENQLDKAEKDIQNLESSKEKKPKVAPLKQNYRKRVIIEKRKQKTAKEQLKSNPGNIQALNMLSESSLRLGEYRTAMTANEKITRLSPENKKAWYNVIYLRKALKLDTKKVIQKANQAGITTEQIKKINPKVYPLKSGN